MITKEQIEKINSLAPNQWQTNEQGIWTEPFGVPNNIKGLVVYQRYEKGGYSGGSCWDDSDPQPYYNSFIPDFTILDLVLMEIAPNITYLQYKKIEQLIVHSEKTEYEYYGNQTDFGMKFIILDDLINLLKEFKQ